MKLPLACLLALCLAGSLLAAKRIVAPKSRTADAANRVMATVKPPMPPGGVQTVRPMVVAPPVVKTNRITVAIPVPPNGVNTTNRYWRRVQTSPDLKTWSDVLTNGVPMAYEELSGYEVTNTFTSTNRALFFRTRKVGTP